MKRIFILLFSLFYILHTEAQETNKVSIDSLYLKLNYAFDLTQKNKIADALEIANEILEIGKIKSNDSLIAYSHNVLGAAYSGINSDSLALKHFKISKEFYKKTNDKAHVIIANNNIGVSYRHLKDYKKAISHFKSASEIAEKENLIRESVFPNYNIAYTKLLSGNNPKEALNFLNKSQYYIEKSNPESVKRIKGDVLEAYGHCYLELKKYKLAEIYLNKAIAYAEANKYMKVLNYSYKLKARMYEELGKHETSNAILYELLKVKDTIVKFEKFNVIKEIEAKYATKENNEKLKYVEKEKKIQEATIKKARNHNILLLTLSIVLLFTGYLIFIKNKQLNFEKTKAENLSKAKSDFYSEISHELRTPLYAVIELSSILLKENQNKNHQAYLESLKFSGNHLLSLINNVLELNKMESGMTKLQTQDFDLKMLITNIIESLEYALKDSKNIIQLEYDSSIPYILTGDSLKLSQILINLIANSTKYTKNGTVKVKIKSVQQDNDSVVLDFKIEDDGPGISEEKQEKIFNNLYQESSNHEGNYKATGLGLSIVKKLLNIMGSDIKIESELSHGSIFKFQLQFKIANSERNPIELYATSLKDLKDCKILVVDDNKINQMVTGKVLKQLNLISQTVDNGTDAIELVKQNHYACVLMDLHMPGMDGYETTKAIRAFNKDIAIVALTAASSEDIKNKINEAQMDGYILKPFIITDFITILKKAITGKISQSA